MSPTHNFIDEIPATLLARLQWNFANGESASCRRSETPLIERQRLIYLMKQDQEYLFYQTYLDRLYGNILSKDHYDSLKESLSFEEQLTLLITYRDHIEEELSQRIPFWKSIPMKCSSSDSSSFIQLNSNDDLSDLTLPGEIDNQWKTKLLCSIIEQGMIFYDNIRFLSSNILSNLHSNEQLIQFNISNQKQRYLVQ